MSSKAINKACTAIDKGNLCNDFLVKQSQTRLKYFGIAARDGSVPKMCSSGGRQSKTIPIPGLRVLVLPNQTWMFPVYNIAIKVP